MQLPFGLSFTEHKLIQQQFQQHTSSSSSSSSITGDDDDDDDEIDLELRVIDELFEEEKQEIEISELKTETWSSLPQSIILEILSFIGYEPHNSGLDILTQFYAINTETMASRPVIPIFRTLYIRSLQSWLQNDAISSLIVHVWNHCQCLFVDSLKSWQHIVPSSDRSDSNSSTSSLPSSSSPSLRDDDELVVLEKWCNLIKNGRLTRLRVENLGRDEWSARCLSRIIAPETRGHKLEVLALSHMTTNLLIDNLVSMVRKSRSLTSLSLEHMDMPANDRKRLTQAIDTNLNLRRLTLRNCGISDVDCKRIANVLKSSSCTIRSLILHYNTNITSTGVRYIAEAMCFNRSLQRLDLHNLGITCSGALLLADMLEQNTSLCWLDLSDNKIVGAVGGRAIAESFINNRTLRFLDLRLNIIPHAERALITRIVRYEALNPIELRMQHKRYDRTVETDSFKKMRERGEIDDNTRVR